MSVKGEGQKGFSIVANGSDTGSFQESPAFQHFPGSDMQQLNLFAM